VPLLAGIAALVLFARLAPRLLSERAAAIAVLLFAAVTPLVVLSAATKQYSTDVLAAVAISAVALPFLPGGWPLRSLVPLGIVGAASPWLSHPAPFVLAGVLLALAVAPVRRRDRRRVLALGAVALICLFSFAGAYRLGQSNVEHVRASLQGRSTETGPSAYMPFPPRSLQDLKWFPRGAREVARGGFGVYTILAPLAGLVLLLGGLVVGRSGWVRLFALASPLVFALIASALRLYPFGGRFVLFAIPPLLLVAAAGLDELLRRPRGRRRWVAPAIAAFVVLPLAASATVALLGRGYHPSLWGREARPVVRYIADRHADGDRLFVAHNIQHAFRYHAERLPREPLPWPIVPTGGGAEQYAPALRSYPPRLVVGKPRRQLAGYVRDLKTVGRGGRAWFILGADEERKFRPALDRLGRRIDRIRRKDVTAVLYELDGSGAAR
jgi:hypothetical protein